MAIDVWFPLAIYYTDLAKHANYKTVHIQKIRTLRKLAGKQCTSENNSWTGDVHKVDQIHNDPSFAWLTSQIEYHALIYLKSLGHNLEKMELYIQRSWPIIARRDQFIPRHAHHTASLSAVYYVSVPKKGYAGQIRFFNESRQNELARGIDNNMTKGYSEYNKFNFQQTNYDPIEGRLLIFPAKQPHDVTANETDDDRISISFDLILVAKNTKDKTSQEFLMPSPDSWKKITQVLSSPEGKYSPEEQITDSGE